MTTLVRTMALLLFIAMVGAIIGGCAAAPTPTPTKPAAAAAATPTKAAPAATATPTKVAFPTKTITWIALGSPGGGADVFARQIQKASQPFFSQPIVVENKAGGTGMVAWEYVYDQPHDGHTVTQMSTGPMNATFLAPTKRVTQDFRIVAIAGTDPQLLQVKSDSPWQTFEDVINYAKANPGKQKWASGGAATLESMIGFALSKHYGYQYAPVSFGGGGEAIVSVLGGATDVSFGSASESAEQIAAGKLRVLATASATRPSKYANVPTLKEKGIDIVLEQFRGVAVPKDVPDAVVNILAEGFKKGIETPDFRKYVESGGGEWKYLAPKEGDAFVADQTKRLETLIKDMGLYARDKPAK